MKSITASTAQMDWVSGSALYGERAHAGGTEVAQLKILSDRRREGQGLAYVVKFAPPPGKLLKIVAVARSDEQTYVLEGGYCNGAGDQLRGPGDSALNPRGRCHGAFIGRETVGLVVYDGEPEEILELRVIERAPSPRAAGA
jgi:hypothetical protein